MPRGRAGPLDTPGFEFNRTKDEGVTSGMRVHFEALIEEHYCGDRYVSMSWVLSG